MTDQSAPPIKFGRLAAVCVAAGLLFVLPASAQSVRRDVQGAQTQAQADAQQDRIEDLQNQLTAATAENENLQHQLLDAQRENQRLQALVGNLAQVNQDIATGRAADAGTQQPSGGSDLSGGPSNGGKPPAPDGPRVEGTLGTLPASDLPGNAGEAYGRARNLLNAGNYPEAEIAFQQFLQTFPDATQAADARYWFAFTLMARHNDQDAAQNFLQYLHDTPQGPRAPEAQLHLGQALVEMGQTSQACAFFTNLPRSYPNASRDLRATAASEAASAHCRH